jgi:hypothetical protein
MASYNLGSSVRITVLLFLSLKYQTAYETHFTEILALISKNYNGFSTREKKKNLTGYETFFTYEPTIWRIAFPPFRFGVTDSECGGQPIVDTSVLYLNSIYFV